MIMVTIPIAEPSVKSLLIRTQFQGQPLGTSTGFTASSAKGPVLITNRHVVTGRHNQTGKPLSPTGGIPDEVVVLHNRAGRLGEWVGHTEPLLGPQGPLWHEHPTLGARADFVALPLTQLTEVALYTYTLGVSDPKIHYGPADVISVIGFPFALQVGGSLAVWATGFVASEPAVDYDGLPLFLIDCRSRPGQSGSAVIAYRSGGIVTLEDGSRAVHSVPVMRFLGIYSGRINDQSDLGLVWKASALQELVNFLK